MSRSRLTVALAGTALVVAAVAVGVAVLVGRAATQPASPSAPTEPVGISSTRLPTPDPSYWTPERMRSAQPAPMPDE